MRVKLKEIKENPGNYKVCRKCGLFNKAENERCHNCNTINPAYEANSDQGFAPTSFTATAVENELDYRCYHEDYLEVTALKIEVKVA